MPHTRLAQSLAPTLSLHFDQSLTLTRTCALIRRGDELVIALGPDQLEAAIVTRANGRFLLAALTEFLAEEPS
jgi:hypothetical protein